MCKCIAAWYTEKDTKQSQFLSQSAFERGRYTRECTTWKSSIFPLYANHNSLGSLGAWGMVVKIVLISDWRVTSTSYLKKPQTLPTSKGFKREEKNTEPCTHTVNCLFWYTLATQSGKLCLDYSKFPLQSGDSLWGVQNCVNRAYIN